MRRESITFEAGLALRAILATSGTCVPSLLLLLIRRSFGALWNLRVRLSRQLIVTECSQSTLKLQVLLLAEDSEHDSDELSFYEAYYLVAVFGCEIWFLSLLNQ